MSVRDVPIPLRMRKLPLDHRGYPIGKGFYVDKAGKPQFTINDETKRQRHIRNDLCAICGTKLMRFRWFIGGPASAYDEHGAYIDPPLHDECAHYALQVCPYLAAPAYAGRIDGKLLSASEKQDMFTDPTMLPYRPDFFVAVCSRGTGWVDDGPLIRWVVPTRPYVRVEHWVQGQQVPVDMAAVEAALARAKAHAQPQTVASPTA